MAIPDIQIESFYLLHDVQVKTFFEEKISTMHHPSNLTCSKNLGIQMQKYSLKQYY